MNPRLLQWENWELEGLLLLFFFNVMSVQGEKSALHTKEDCWKHNFNGAQTCTRQLVLGSTQQVTISSWLTKTSPCYKNLRKRRTKSLSGWKRNACYGNACYAGNIKTKFQSTYILAVRRNRRQETVSMPIKYSLK